MTTFWTYNNLARVTGGTWRVPPGDGDAPLPAARRPAGPVLWHDTRELEPGQCYLAIKGENFDGHDFLNQAFDAGASLAIVNADSEKQSVIRNPQSAILEVEDTVKALQDLARCYRDELAKGSGSGAGGCKVIGVAGSNGKTTTRHLIHHVLTHAGKRGTQSPKSFNNHLGVPLTLLAARPGDDFVACEIGTNHPGEIDHLGTIARPDIAVITSIGEEHLEFFKTVANVAREEAAIMSHVAPNGWVLAPKADWDRYLAKHSTRTDIEIAHGTMHLDGLVSIGLDRGGHMESNAQMSIAAAMCFCVDESACELALQEATFPRGRGETIDAGEVCVIHDAYNANPSSARAAINALSMRDLDQPDRRKVFIFGDMLELGDRAEDAHRSMGVWAETDEIDLLICIGPLAQHARAMLEQLPSHGFPDWSDGLPEKVAVLLRPGDTVLLKASRGMRLERLIPAIEKRFGKAAPTVENRGPHPS